MSYDLYFRPRQGTPKPGVFRGYFSARPHYKIDSSQAIYTNEDTGVYFIFDDCTDNAQSDDPEDPGHPYAVSINYCRPSFFILEAEPEVSAFVQKLDLLVSDPQVDGMGDGEFDRDQLLTGWNKGNALGYAAILKDPKSRATIKSLPRATLMRSWAWNLERAAFQDKLGESKFVPCVFFFLVDDQPATIAAWPDGIPIAVPEVDYIFIPRKELAPRKLFRRIEDVCLVKYADVLPLLAKHRSSEHSSLVLAYDVPPPEIADFVRNLAPTTATLQGVTVDTILDRELVESVV
jgi:hypothetical protein